MKRKKIISLLIVTVMCSLVLTTFSTSSFALSRRSEGGASCAGTGCHAQATSGYGNQVVNSSGSGPLSGYHLARFDAFRPEPGLFHCAPQSKDRALYSDLGVPSNYGGDSYMHRRVAASREDPNIAFNGVAGSVNWGTGQDFNLNRGTYRASSNLTLAPKGSGSDSTAWVGPNWQGTVYCLPLRGGGEAEADLSIIQPKLKASDRESDATHPVRVINHAKNATITLDLTNSRDLTSDEFNFAFALNDVVPIVCDITKQKAYETTHGEPAPLFYGCFLATDSRSPVFLKTEGVTYNDDGTTTFPVKYKKKGNYGIYALAVYDGLVTINGELGVFGATGLSAPSNVLYLNVVSIKSVSRK